MRSHDYCHFEVNLAIDLAGYRHEEQHECIDDLRKEAARLADKAVEQYKVAKLALARKETIADTYSLARAREMPESERTPLDKARIKYADDKEFAARFNYDYEDGYDEDEMFGV